MILGFVDAFTVEMGFLFFVLFFGGFDLNSLMLF